jgi:hypothetical protein
MKLQPTALPSAMPASTHALLAAEPYSQNIATFKIQQTAKPTSFFKSHYFHTSLETYQNWDPEHLDTLRLELNRLLRWKNCETYLQITDSIQKDLGQQNSTAAELQTQQPQPPLSKPSAMHRLLASSRYPVTILCLLMITKPLSHPSNLILYFKNFFVAKGIAGPCALFLGHLIPYVCIFIMYETFPNIYKQFKESKGNSNALHDNPIKALSKVAYEAFEAIDHTISIHPKSAFFAILAYFYTMYDLTLKTNAITFVHYWNLYIYQNICGPAVQAHNFRILFTAFANLQLILVIGMFIAPYLAHKFKGKFFSADNEQEANNEPEADKPQNINPKANKLSKFLKIGIFIIIFFLTFQSGEAQNLGGNLVFKLFGVFAIALKTTLIILQSFIDPTAGALFSIATILLCARSNKKHLYIKENILLGVTSLIVFISSSIILAIPFHLYTGLLSLIQCIVPFPLVSAWANGKKRDGLLFYIKHKISIQNAYYRIEQYLFPLTFENEHHDKKPPGKLFKGIYYTASTVASGVGASFLSLKLAAYFQISTHIFVWPAMILVFCFLRKEQNNLSEHRPKSTLVLLEPPSPSSSLASVDSHQATGSSDLASPHELSGQHSEEESTIISTKIS